MSIDLAGLRKRVTEETMAEWTSVRLDEVLALVEAVEAAHELDVALKAREMHYAWAEFSKLHAALARFTFRKDTHE